MWDWFEFNSIDHFNSWHDELCTKLGYPLISQNQATGEPDPNAAMTKSYCEPYEVDGKIIAFIEVEYSEGLIKSSLKYEPIREIRNNETLVE